MIVTNSCFSNDETLKSHHTPYGFRNLNPKIEAKGIVDVLNWQVSRLFQDLPSLNPLDYKFEIVANDGKLLRENQNTLSATWIGHASLLIQIDGKNILTDPIWSERCSPVSFLGPKRYTPAGIQMENLPEIHIVLISHNHYDHMDIPTLRELERRFSPYFLVGLKNGAFLKSEGLTKVIELDWWESYTLFNLEIHFTPTQHFSARGLWDRNKTLWGSFVVRSEKNSFYFAGDTGYFSHFQEIGKKFPNLDLAILPIGAYEPRWFMKPVHMNPEDSVQAFLDLKASYMIPMHYQTFVLTDEALDEPLKFTKQEFEKKVGDMSRLIDLKIGETRFFP
ncbi:MAG: MBL fold metallo-hydrolase [Leptospiraceae bacterium]|nr:MBL fold metallo-hydrolase [Leptospiraceae bacterium]